MRSLHFQTVFVYACAPLSGQRPVLNTRAERSSQHSTDIQVPPPNQTSVSTRNAIRATTEANFPAPSGIHHYAPGPPRSLTASLGREIEKFDQLCDALESRLVRMFLILRPTEALTMI